MVSLNHCDLSARTGFSREEIEDCLRQVVVTIHHGIHTNQIVDVFFSDIGQLRINSNKVKFRYFDHFLQDLDKTGTLVRALRNRPNTVDSAISNLSTVNEELACQSSHTSECQTHGMSLSPLGSNSNSLKRPVLLSQEHALKGALSSPSRRSSQALRDPGSRMDQIEDSIPPSVHLSTPQSHGGSDYGDLKSGGIRSPVNTPESGADYTNTDYTTDTALTDESRMLGPCVRDTFAELPSPQESAMADSRCKQASVKCQSMEDGSTSPPSRNNSSEALRIQALRSQLRLLSEKLRPTITPCTSKATSNLCYVCHQRRARNVSVNLKDEAKKREQDEEQMLLKYQRLRAENEAKREKEYADAKKQRLEAQAAYNLAASGQNKRQEIQESAKRSSLHMLLRRRCTPPKRSEQEILRVELDKQTEWKRLKQQKEAEDLMNQGRLEQKRLAEQLVSDTLMQHKQKLEKQMKYKEVLDDQVMKHKERAQAEVQFGVQSMFGAHQCNPTKVEERKRMALELRKAQMKAAEDRLMKLKMDQEQKVEDERNALLRVQEDLVSEELRRRKALEAIRRQLQADWTRDKEEKRLRDEIERILRICPSDMTLMEQCDLYRRCTQCKRDLNNSGRSNLGTDTIAPGMAFVR